MLQYLASFFDHPNTNREVTLGFVSLEFRLRPSWVFFFFFRMLTTGRNSRFHSRFTRETFMAKMAKFRSVWEVTRSNLRDSGRHVFTHSPVPLHGTFQRSRLYNSKVVDFFRNYFICKLPRAYLSGHPPPRNPLNSCLGITTVDGSEILRPTTLGIYIQNPILKQWFIFSTSTGWGWKSREFPVASHPPSTTSLTNGGRFRRRRHGTKSCNMCASDKLRLPGGLRGMMMAPSECSLIKGSPQRVL